MRPLLPLPAPHARRLSPGRGAGAGAAGRLGGPRCTPLLGACRSAACGRHRGLGGAHCGTQPWPRWASGRAGRGQLGFLLVRAGHWLVRPDPPTGVSPARRVPADAGHGVLLVPMTSPPAPSPCQPDALGPLSGEGGGGGGRGPRPFLLVLCEPVACRAQGRPRGSHCTAREGPAAGWPCATATCDPCRSQPFSKPRRGPEGPAGARAVCVYVGGVLCAPQARGAFQIREKCHLKPGVSLVIRSKPSRAAVMPRGCVVTGPRPPGPHHPPGGTEPCARRRAGQGRRLREGETEATCSWHSEAGLLEEVAFPPPAPRSGTQWCREACDRRPGPGPCERGLSSPAARSGRRC